MGDEESIETTNSDGEDDTSAVPDFEGQTVFADEDDDCENEQM